MSATSNHVPRRRFLAEPLETTSRSYRRQPSDRSDASPSPSTDSDSTASSMAATGVLCRNGQLKNEAESLEDKSEVLHLEHKRVAGADATNGTNAVNGHLHVNNLHTQQDSGSSQHKPRRKFAVEPVEISSRTSRRERAIETEAAPMAKRKFTPEPLETTSRSSKAKDDEKPDRPRRKFNVEPVETSSSSSREKGKKTDGLENGARPKRRFAVEPVETSTRSSKDTTDNAPKPRRKFAVEPIETTASSSRKQHDNSSSTSDDKSDISGSRTSSRGSRKFSPELVATAKASYRKKPEVKSAVPRWLRDEAEEEGSWSAPEIPESKFSAANLVKKARADPRRHSYSVPDLPIIPSDSSEEEELSPVTPGAISQYNSRDNNLPKARRHIHDHVRDQHLQDLRTLREQAVAAYGQQEDQVHFAHFGGDEDDEDHSFAVGRLAIHDNADPSLFRRMSHHDLELVQEDMRRHHDQLEKAKQGLQEDTAGISRFSAAALAARHHLNIHHPEGSHYQSRHETRREGERKDEDAEFAKMRKAASPPMQGEEIKFPFSISPKMTRCDPDQAPRPRRANSEEEEEHDIGTEGMWSAHVSPTKKDAPVGLWGGLCQKDENRPAQPSTPLRSGIQTPAFEHGNPFEPRTPGRGTKTPKRGEQMWGGSAWMPLTPPRSKHERATDSFAAALDQKLSLEQQIDKEFSPKVITQIYNYLSLGYPPIARPFDEELSKISRISIADLRKGDRSDTGTMRGHVGVPEGEGDGEEDEEGRVKYCRRWEALRLYVREWARQSPNFAEQGVIRNVGTGMWGNNAPVRKGSWGF